MFCILIIFQSLFIGLITYGKIFFKGNVVGGQTKAPVRNISVIFRQKEVDRTNKDGTFSFIIPDNADRVTLTFQDPTDQFLDTTQTIPFQRGQTVFHRIVLQKEDPPVTFDSGQELKVPLGHAEDNMAVLEMPADNLLHKDGKPFKGEVKFFCLFYFCKQTGRRFLSTMSVRGIV